ncbi:MAG TPA: methyltransferase [Firmicutes bacterium]|nr:methyltransferase [Bacillota bacterium]
MTSRERVELALAHMEPDRVPVDIGGSVVTGMQVQAVYRLRQALKLDPPGTPVKVIEPYQMLGEIKPDLARLLGVDVVALNGPRNMFGFANTGWRPWRTPDGTPVLVPEKFNTVPEPDGSILMYPEGDKSVPPSAKMPAGGWYFDSLSRQEPIDDARLNVTDNLEEFQPISPEDLRYFAEEAKRLYDETDQAILANFGGTGFGDVALITGLGLKHPKGIRDVEEWYISLCTRQDYILELFDRQCAIAIENLAKIYDAVGNRITAVFVSGTDFGTQRGLFCSRESYRQLFFPFHKRVNDWIHAHTKWKTFLHSCGSVVEIIPDFIEAGFDILNPVQCSAAGMDPQVLKERFGDRIVFWGGGVDTQRTLPFGTPEEVAAQVRERLRIFAPGGGYIFNTIHNIQADTPVENILAMFDSLKDYGSYPIKQC